MSTSSSQISMQQVFDALFLLAPQFNTVDPVVLAQYENLYTLLLCQFNAQVMACCGVLALALLMAAYLSLTPNLGVYSNMSEGQLSLGLNVNPDINFLLLSPYGRAWVDLVGRTVVGSTVTNIPVSLGGVFNNAPVTCGCNGGGWGYGMSAFSGN